MFERSDRQNPAALEKDNRMGKPLVSKGAIRLLTWPAYAAIVFLLVVGVVCLAVHAFQ